MTLIEVKTWWLVPSTFHFAISTILFVFFSTALTYARQIKGRVSFALFSIISRVAQHLGNRSRQQCCSEVAPLTQTGGARGWGAGPLPGSSRNWGPILPQSPPPSTDMLEFIALLQTTSKKISPFCHHKGIVTSLTQWT